MKTVALCMTLAVFLVQHGIAQSITVTSFPPAGTSDYIYGYVSGVEDPTRYRLAIVINVFDSLWSKPTFATPYAAINPDGSFAARFITGGQDICASHVHLFLVPEEFTIPLVSGGSIIPHELIDAALASTSFARSEPATIEWSGYTWHIKDTGGCRWGPGPNYFSKDGVRLDENGGLQLTIRRVDGEWRCAEIYLGRSLGYGTYRFKIRTNNPGWPRQLVFGCFVYDDDPSYAHREIDIENNNGYIVESGDRPWQVAVQPCDVPNHRYAFAIPKHWAGSVQQFLWMPGIVSFSAFEPETAFTDAILASYALDVRAHPDGAWMSLEGIPGFATLERQPVPTKVRVYSGTEHAWYLSRYFRARLTGVWPVADNPPHAAWAATDGIPPEGNERVRINAWLARAAGFVPIVSSRLS